MSELKTVIVYFESENDELKEINDDLKQEVFDLKIELEDAQDKVLELEDQVDDLENLLNDDEYDLPNITSKTSRTNGLGRNGRKL